MESTPSDRVVVTSTGTILFWCPGCRELHAVWQESNPNQKTGAWWAWNGDKRLPTFTPSVLVHGHIEAGRIFVPRCHSFVKAGQIQYLTDCQHELAGKTVPLPENPLECHP